MLRILMLALLLLPLAAHAREWRVDPAASSLGFKGTYQGDPFEGRFKAFDATIRYDANQLADAKFDVSVDLASVDTESAERDDTLAGSDFFDTGRFPKARFVTESFARGADGGVVAHGKLTIRDRTQPVTLKVAFVERGGSATLDVDTVLRRADFGLGSGSDWSDVGAEVPVHGHLVLVAQ
ncbi:MAG: polyisoprenoid-binding protein [Lysobacteraceae bacterium]|nr:MAG: polyisoprenoid-binding protein [Xanthomonadaceae bacterium]